MNKVIKKLQPPEQARFNDLEQICVEGRFIWFVVGKALAEIKERKFYESKGFATFPDYADSIGYSRRYCDQLIMSANVTASLPEALRKSVITEKAARAIARLPQDLRVSVVIKATKGGEEQATETNVRKSSPPPRKPKGNSEPSAPKESKASTPPPRKAAPPRPSGDIIDETGYEVPKELWEYWKRRDEIQEIISHINFVKGEVKRAREISDACWVTVNFNSVESNIAQLTTDLEVAKPYAVCPTCQGKIPKGCLACKGLGLVSKFYWDTCVPDEVKKVRGGK
jgi:hypothetical protein